MTLKPTTILDTLHARVFMDSVFVRGHRHGAWLIQLLAGEIEGIPGATGVSDYTRAAADILEALEAQGQIKKDPRGASPTPDQCFFGMGGSMGRGIMHHPATWLWIRC